METVKILTMGLIGIYFVILFIKNMSRKKNNYISKTRKKIKDKEWLMGKKKYLLARLRYLKRFRKFDCSCVFRDKDVAIKNSIEADKMEFKNSNRLDFVNLCLTKLN